jgi:DNA repair protein RecO (recombination protein O)
MIIRDKGIVIKIKKFEERYVIASCFLKSHGLVNGIVNISNKKQQTYIACQPGNIVEASWNARVREQLGRYTLELYHNTLAMVFGNNLMITILNSALAVISLVLHERETQLELFNVFENFLNSFVSNEKKYIYRNYLNLELITMKAGGFGLAIDKCVVTGVQNHLLYISPKSGAAACEEVGLQYHDKLLQLPPAMVDNSICLSERELLDCLAVIGFFMQKNILNTLGQKMPIERYNLLEILKKVI